MDGILPDVLSGLAGGGLVGKEDIIAAGLPDAAFPARRPEFVSCRPVKAARELSDTVTALNSWRDNEVKVVRHQAVGTNSATAGSALSHQLIKYYPAAVWFGEWALAVERTSGDEEPVAGSSILLVRNGASRADAEGPPVVGGNSHLRSESKASSLALRSITVAVSGTS